MADSRLAARISLDLGLRRLAAGDIGGAVDEFRNAIRTNPALADAYYHLAGLLVRNGDHDAAVRVFALGLNAAPQGFRDPDFMTRLQGRAFDPAITRAFYDALAATAPEIRRALAPTDPLGHYSVGNDARQDASIRDLLDTHWENWETGRSVPPRDADKLVDIARRFIGPLPRVLLLMPHYVSCHPDYVKSTVASHALASLNELGAEVELHAGDHLCFDAVANASRPDRLPANTARAEFAAHLGRFRPDVVVMDAMFTEANGALTRAELRALKLRYGFKLVALVTDAYAPLTNFALHWADVTDLAVALTGQSYLREVAKFTATLQAPCQPIARSLMGTTSGARDIDFLYVGSRRRYRDLWCAHAVAAGLQGEIILSDRRAASAPDETEFYGLLHRARLTVNSGYVQPGVDIATFRLFEAAATGTLVLNETRAPNADYFVPHVHYVPFGNVHEMVCYARFLLGHEDYRARMAEAARTWLWDHFAPHYFWRAVFAELLETACGNLASARS